MSAAEASNNPPALSPPVLASPPSLPPPSPPPPPYAVGAGAGIIGTVESLHLADLTYADVSWSSAELQDVLGAAAGNDDAVTVSSAATSPCLMPMASDDIPAPPRQVHWSESVGSTTDSAIDEEENVEGDVDGGELANGDDQSVEGDPEEENIQPLTILTDPCVFIQPPSESDRWYVVIKGWRIGVFDNW